MENDDSDDDDFNLLRSALLRRKKNLRARQKSRKKLFHSQFGIILCRTCFGKNYLECARKRRKREPRTFPHVAQELTPCQAQDDELLFHRLLTFTRKIKGNNVESIEWLWPETEKNH